MIAIFVASIILLINCNLSICQYNTYSENIPKSLDGTLYGDIYNWVDLIQNYIKQLAFKGIRKDVTQSLFDQAKYTLEDKNGNEIIKELSEKLGVYFDRRKQAALRIADAARNFYDQMRQLNKNYTNIDLKKLSANVYMDSDNPKTLPSNLEFNSYFKQNVSTEHSTIKIADEVPRYLNTTIFTVDWTHQLEQTFKYNTQQDMSIRWQYFGSTAGVLRLYPGREWSSNFVGFYTDYDPRVRPWYISATSGPKDLVIVIDCSLSMTGEKFSIAKEVAKAIIETLTKQDYLNVICARNSHWDEIGKWHFFKSEALSCRPNNLVPATIAHRKDLIENIEKLKAGGTTELETGFELAFDLLNSYPRTGCNSIMVFLTDGLDTDGENVRCGPGYYTRSGYVPGPVCKYNWTKVQEVINKTNNVMSTHPARIFSYLVKDDGEMLAGSVACLTGGSVRKIKSGENLISQLSNYFEYLAKATKVTEGLFTSPYIDSLGTGLMITIAVPVISKVDNLLIGVAAVDLTLEEIEMVLTQYQWGSVTSFLINNRGHVIFHPLLKPSTNLADDPIFIQIQTLEQDKQGHPEEFSKVADDMRNLRKGHIRIEHGRKGTPKGDFRAGVKYDIMPLEYFYSPLANSDVYSVALVLADTDKVFRRLEEPSVDLRQSAYSYFNLLIEYNSSKVRQSFPQVFDRLNVKFNEVKYPLLRVTYNHSSVFFAPTVHCDPNMYFFDDDLAQKTLDAHKYMNNMSESDLGCNDQLGKYVRGTRAYVLVTQAVEDHWKKRDFESIEDVTWTYVGMRSGVFRTYPGHRSTRLYDPTKRPWYRRTMANPTKISISTPYSDAAGSGKIITISQAVFEGMQQQTIDYCNRRSKSLKPGGCPCSSDTECISGYCYISTAPGPAKMANEHRCATERIEAITSADIGYDSFHKRIYKVMHSSDGGMKSCNMSYTCPQSKHVDGDLCLTKCYIFDDRGNVIMANEFVEASVMDTNKYTGKTLGKMESEIMKDLIYRHRFFERTESIDFQGTCSYVPSFPKVTVEGLPRTPEELDNYYKTRGPIPSFRNSYGCVQDVVTFSANYSALGSSRMLVGNVSGPCAAGFYYVTSVPDTNLFLLVVENRVDRRRQHSSVLSALSPGECYNFNCEISRKIVASGAYRIINGTCAHKETNSRTSTLFHLGKCPRLLSNLTLKCQFKQSHRNQCFFTEYFVISFGLMIVYIFV